MKRFSNSSGARLCASCIAASLLLAPVAAAAHEQHAAHAQQAAAGASAPASSVRVRLEDVALRDQDGREVRFLSDVLGKHVAVVNFVYTTCTTTCPVSSATLAELQRRLGASVGSDVVLVTITTDPARDTPARMKETAARFGAGSGWRWLTGRKGDVDRVLKAFGAYTPNPEDHPPMTLVGHAASGQWTRLYGFAAVDELQSHVDKAVAAAGSGAHRH
jgi:protein SCO1/2